MTDSEPGDQTPADDARPATPKARQSGHAARGHRRAAAREKAQLARKRQKRRARGGRWAIQGAVALVIVAVVAAVVLVVVKSNEPQGPGPANMASDGITIGAGFRAIQSGALQPSDEPTAVTTTAAVDTVDIVVYLDYLDKTSGDFTKADNDYIRGLVRSGAATIEYHPIAVLTNQSLGSKYSQRAANAGACVANYSPDAYFGFNSAMFDKQPAEGTAGLTDAQLITLVKGVEGISKTSQIATCITDQTYKSWVTNATQRALDGPLVNTDVKKVTDTPLILVNGQEYGFSTPFQTSEFSNFVVTAAGNSYADNSTSSPTPTAGATPTGSATPTPSSTAPNPTASATATSTPTP